MLFVGILAVYCKHIIIQPAFQNFTASLNEHHEVVSLFGLLTDIQLLESAIRKIKIVVN